ncbi:DNA-directed RNA polymerase subunit beta' [Candidatus Absconditicoccus praedator]|uniref:DNA-directed RNA polymerase subunit beta' n=1 Tax=Candidatus Absconditicoccus praedator TaxID=2735562 RepID=UPI001EFF5219|nr:DNA-directed RNA polymerase subunit beta' [Candidatus Absconditicoccus praedator]
MLQKGFEGLMVKLASPEDIKSWSYGSVTSPDTINYRTGKPKQGGLFCESIFGPIRNFECSCGKYKGVRYKGIVCERCGVEVTSSRVRRERMGHIELASPVVHIWYVKATPSRIGLLLNLSVKEIEKILYFVKYIVVDYDKNQKKNAIANLDKSFQNKLTDLDKYYDEEISSLEKQKDELSNKEYQQKKQEIEKTYSENKDDLEKEYNRIKSILSNLKKGSTILESDYRNIFYKYEGVFTFKSGSTAILKLLEDIDLEKEISEIIKNFRQLKGPERDKTFKRLRLLINLHVSKVRPEWIVLKNLPVMPPDLRPVVQLEGGKFASSDINLFYRRVLMRNLRLQKMIDAGMPDVIKKNEIRLLQESVNNLIVGEKDSATKNAGMKVFKSLTDMLSGKEGIFRKNLLGKRVDYSGRSVITVGPNLKLDECGLPIYIAVRMFSPFIISKLIEKNIAHTPKQAEKLIKDEDPVALKILKEVIDGKYVLLNRAPTLHRLGIQAFRIRLMPGKTIRIHPLVCPAFNADFDGDQMAAHLPLSEESQKEAKELVAADKNILAPASGSPIITHTQDMILGAYYLTNDKLSEDKVVGRFGSIEEVVNAYYSSNVQLGDKVVLYYNGEEIKTTVGRVVFNSLIPEKIRFIDEIVRKGQLKSILDKVYNEYGREKTVEVADNLKDWGFKYATISAVSVNIFDLHVPKEKQALLAEGDEKVKKIHDFWFKGFLSDDEKHRLIVNIWSDVKSEIEKLVKMSYVDGNDVYSLVDSGARGNWSQLSQLSGIKGLVVSPSGSVIELPIKSSLIEGFSPIEYFIAAHGARKGKADTALKTAESGYLTRRLVDASQEVVVKEHDCGTDTGILISKDEAEIRGDNFYDMLYGRVSLEDLKDDNGNTIVQKDELINANHLQKIKESNIDMINVRSPLGCKIESGVCQKCYGMDLSKRDVADIGAAVGVIASQSIGEPGTQLTMRTFHGGGVASADGDMTQGIKRIEELFEIRKPKNSAIVAPFDGILKIIETGKLLEAEITSNPEKINYIVKEGYTITVKNGDYLKKGGVYAMKGKSQLKVKQEGVVETVGKDHIVLSVTEKYRKPLAAGTQFKVKDGAQVYKGQVVSTGALDIKEYKSIVSDIEAQKYIVREIKRVFTSQGQDVNDKYMEIIVKQLFSKVLIDDSGDSALVPGSVVSYESYLKINEELTAEGKKPASGERLALGLTQIAKESESWLSSASFQETMRIMVDSSTKGAIDQLHDLKSNVIIGRLLPLGDVYRNEYFGQDYEEQDASKVEQDSSQNDN